MSESDPTQAANYLRLGDPRWQTFWAVDKAFKDLSAGLQFDSRREGFAWFYLHSENTPDEHHFTEVSVDDPTVAGKLFKATVDGDRFTLKVKTAIPSAEWDEGHVDDEAGLIHMGLQDELGLSVPSQEDLNDFQAMVEQFTSDMVHKRVESIL